MSDRTTEGMTRCVLCDQSVPKGQESEHIKAFHPGAPFRFWLDNREYASELPSMTVLELMTKCQVPADYHFYQHVGTQDVQLNASNAVDLTCQPRFFTCPRCTYA